MNYLIIAATATEIGPYLNQAELKQDTNSGADVLITGVGLTATTYNLTRQVSIKKPDLIIQAGIAGCFDRNISLGSVLLVGAERIADEGVMEPGQAPGGVALSRWKSPMDMGFTDPGKIPYTGGWLLNPDPALAKYGLPVVPAVSVNQVSTNGLFIDTLRSASAPVLESMEGAALHYVAISENIPFLQIRAVSNYVGERDKQNWDIKNAVLNLNKELIRLLPLL